MKLSYVDSDVIIRLLTGDDPRKQEAAAKLFEKVEKREISLKITETGVADCVYVLSSTRLYSLPRDEIREILGHLISLVNLKVQNKQAILKALELYSSTNIDFSDCLIAVLVKQNKVGLYSYDRDFDRIGITRKEP